LLEARRFVLDDKRTFATEAGMRFNVKALYVSRCRAAHLCHSGGPVLEQLLQKRGWVLHSDLSSYLHHGI
jgi:hypothetical protein